MIPLCEIPVFSLGFNERAARSTGPYLATTTLIMLIGSAIKVAGAMVVERKTDRLETESNYGPICETLKDSLSTRQTMSQLSVKILKKTVLVADTSSQIQIFQQSLSCSEEKEKKKERTIISCKSRRHATYRLPITPNNVNQTVNRLAFARNPANVGLHVANVHGIIFVDAISIAIKTRIISSII